MVRDNAMPDVLAYRLDKAVAILTAAGFKYRMEKTMPLKPLKELVWHDENAYVLKQTLLPDDIINIVVGCKLRREVY
jgi:outer membrane lipopolysaccharide assembly protein LptE/RlpB